MALFKVVVEAYLASRELDQASLSRLAFWCDELGAKEIAAISADDIDAALLRLAERGRLVAGKRATARSGQPLAGSTINRYLTQAGSVFKHAKRLRLAGVSQQMIMQSMGHRTLTASARYAHANVADKKAVVARVFG